MRRKKGKAKRPASPVRVKAEDTSPEPPAPSPGPSKLLPPYPRLSPPKNTKGTNKGKNKGGISRELRELQRDPWSADIDEEPQDEVIPETPRSESDPEAQEDEEEARDAPDTPPPPGERVPFPSVSPAPQRRYPDRARNAPRPYWIIDAQPAPPAFDDDSQSGEEGGDLAMVLRAMEIIYWDESEASYDTVVRRLVERVR